MQNKPITVSAKQVKDTAQAISLLPKDRQALVLGFMQGVLSVKVPFDNQRKRKTRANTNT